MMKRGSLWTIAPVLLLSCAVRLVAQDPAATLKEAIDLYERGRDEEALGKLKAVIAADPSSEVAWSLRNSVDFRTWARAMVKGDEHASVIRHLFNLSLPAEKAAAKDEAAIRGLIDTMENNGSFAERQKAAFKLAADHGEYVVPHLVSRLGSDSTETRAATMEWLRRLGVQAVMPLIQALELGNPMVSANALTVLGQIRDRRALPYVGLWANGPVSVDPLARSAAQRALSDLSSSGGVTDFLGLAERYYQRDANYVDPFRSTYVAWGSADGKLVANEVPREVYHLKLAEEVLYDLMAVDAGNTEAKTLLASTLIAQHSLFKHAGSGEDAAPVKALSHTSEMIRALGPDAVDAALKKALADGKPEVAAGAIEVLKHLLDSDSFRAPSGLTDALSSPAKEVRFLAAQAITAIGPRSNFQGQEQVVPALMEALGQDAVRTVVVIDDQAETRNRIVADLNARGYMAYGAQTGPLGLAAVRNFPIEDLVIIRHNLRDATVAEVVKTLRADPRSAEKAIVVLADAGQIAAAKESFGDRVQGYIESPMVPESYEPSMRELIKISDPERERATMLASMASEALAHLHPREGLFPTGSAVSALVGTLKGDDRVRTPALMALGRIGDPASMAPIMSLFGDTTATEKVRGHAAVALAKIARSSGSASTELLTALGTAIAGDGSQEYLDLLGEACGIVPADANSRLALLNALRTRIRVDTVEG